MSCIDTYCTQYHDTFSKAAEMYIKDEDGDLKKFSENLLKEADINISDFKIESEEIMQEQREFRDVPFSGLNPEIKLNRVKYEMFHDVGSKRYKLDFEEGGVTKVAMTRVMLLFCYFYKYFNFSAKK